MNGDRSTITGLEDGSAGQRVRIKDVL